VRDGLPIRRAPAGTLPALMPGSWFWPDWWVLKTGEEPLSGDTDDGKRSSVPRLRFALLDNLKAVTQGGAGLPDGYGWGALEFHAYDFAGDYQFYATVLLTAGSGVVGGYRLGFAETSGGH
jgi:hypothetical protein